ncbi:MAG UNVERIFIED_CONTAM: hypothetical protein LVR18_43615 [Planctomycetaceae bacterium]
MNGTHDHRDVVLFQQSGALGGVVSAKDDDRCLLFDGKGDGGVDLVQSIGVDEQWDVVFEDGVDGL